MNILAVISFIFWSGQTDTFSLVNIIGNKFRNSAQNGQRSHKTLRFEHHGITDPKFSDKLEFFVSILLIVYK